MFSFESITMSVQISLVRWQPEPCRYQEEQILRLGDGEFRRWKAGEELSDKSLELRRTG